jgi:hypothetical protein
MSNGQLCRLLVVVEWHSGLKAKMAAVGLSHNYSPISVDPVEPRPPRRMKDEVRYE